MATVTLGTAATTTLTAVAFSQVPATLSDADLATINQGILDDRGAFPVAHLIGAGGFVREGFLYVPNRGQLRLEPGDYVGWDTATGWPILVSARAAAAAGWVHT